MAIGRIPEAGTGIPESIVDAKGDLITATAADTPARLAVGSNNQTLVADSAEATGLKYAASLQSTLTTTGDIIYASAANTPARLGIGSSGQVLSVSSGIPAWTTASGGALTKITSADFSAQSSVAVDSVFSSSYSRYMIIITATGSSGDADFRLQMRYAGPTTETGANYYGPMPTIGRTGTTWTQNGFVGTSHMRLIGSNLQIDPCGITLYATNVGNSSNSPRLWWSGTTGADQVFIGSGRTTTQRTYTGFLLSADTGTITGSYQVYGLAN